MTIGTREDLLAALRAADTNGGVFRKKDVFAIAHPMGIEKLNWLL